MAPGHLEQQQAGRSVRSPEMTGRPVLPGCLIVWVLLGLGALADAQETLVGTWQLVEAEPVRFTLQLKDDGRFEVVLPAPLVFEEEEAEGGFDLSAFALGAEFLLSGNWSAEGGRLDVSVEEATFSASGRSLETFLVEAGRALAGATAEAEGVPEEGYETFERDVVDLLLRSFPPAALLEEVAAFFDGASFEYAVSGDVLSLTDEEGTEEWTRLSPTAVPAAGWGRVKSAPR